MLTIKSKQHYDCDVLIAGGGPAGSGLAHHLAKSGCKVIVIDAASFPRDKICGDGVSPIALAELHNMGITETNQFAEANEIRQVGLFIKNDKVIIPLSKPDHLPFHARIIPRLQLDHWIVNAAKQAGAVYREGTRVIGYSTMPAGVNITVKSGKDTTIIRAKLVVGADGSSSTIARQLNGRKADEEFQLLGLRSYFEGVNGPTDRVDIYFSEESFPGIFWMFPKGAAGANIGMAMVSKTLPTKPSHVKELLTNHIQTNPDILDRIGKGTMQGKIAGWPITFYNKKSIITGERVLLAGDAAGLINPLSGDGIQYSLLSARWASEVIKDCLQANDFSARSLYSYRKKIDSELGYDFALSNLLVQFPRNKSLSKVWMTILEVMIARAKADKEYADTIAGIFEGTYPSYKALNASFITKSLKQGVSDLGQSFFESTKDPASIIPAGTQLLGNVLSIVSEISTYNRDQLTWLKKTLEKTVAVGGKIVSHHSKMTR